MKMKKTIHQQAPDIELPEISTAPGCYWCLHLPNGYYNALSSLERELRRITSGRNQKIAFAQSAQPRRSLVRLLKKRTTVAWLMSQCRLTEEQARSLIDSLGVHVHEDFACNAGNPRCLLGIAAALHTQPDVLVYSTMGLDPLGRKAAIEYVDRHRTGR